MVRVYDIHSHLYEYSDSEIEEMLERDRDLVIVAVSDDPWSAKRTLEIWERFPDRVVPCIGYHPWNLREGGALEAEESLRMAYRHSAPCIGEVGLDLKFLDHSTITAQLTIFRKFVALAAETSAFLNVHAPGAWKLAANVISEHPEARAVIHWYTGPITLAETLSGRGYMFSVNAALRVQRKSLENAKRIPLEAMVFESDGPYDYKGLKLSPLMVRDTIKLVAELRGLSFEEIAAVAVRNSEKLVMSAL